MINRGFEAGRPDSPTLRPLRYPDFSATRTDLGDNLPSFSVDQSAISPLDSSSSRLSESESAIQENSEDRPNEPNGFQLNTSQSTPSRLSNLPSFSQCLYKVFFLQKSIASPERLNMLIGACTLILCLYIWRAIQAKDSKTLQADHILNLWTAEKDFRDDCRNHNVRKSL